MTGIRREDEPIKCNYIDCAHGMGQAGMGKCPGDWDDPDCKKFITDEEYEESFVK